MLPDALEPYSILIVLLLAMVLFISNRLRFDIVALLTLAVSVIIGAVPFHLVYSGLDNSAVITVACVMVISFALNESGILNTAVDKLSHVTKNKFLHITILCIITAILSAFMNNVGALALLMPIAIRTSIENKRSPAIILMPMALASAMGGLTTMIGTPPNLLISSFRQQALGEPFAMFDFGKVGLWIAIAGVIFIVLVGWRLLPIRKSTEHSDDIFQIEDYITEIKVTEKSSVIDQSIGEFEKLLEEEYVVLGMIRNHQKRFSLRASMTIEANDILIIEATSGVIEKLLSKGKLEIYGDRLHMSDELHSDDIATMEAVVPQASRMEGRSWQASRLRSRYQINLLAIAREGKPFKERMNHVVLQAGDVVLLQGPQETLRSTSHRIGLLPLIGRGITTQKKNLAYLPLLIFIVAIILAAVQWVPVQVSFGGAVLLMALTRTIPIRQLYDSIEWPIIILLAAMIPVGNALVTTGGTDLITHSLLSVAKEIHPIGMLALLLIVTMTLSDFMNNAVTTVVMAPIAISIARALGVAIDPFLMAVAVGASCSFLTPIGHQNNTLVMGPGGYKFSDYIRIGLPLEIIVIVISIPLIEWIWPL
ncbi:MAG: SLC13 family permease [Coxiellaceae bacterium]|nr:SLC13 family permease [Coxiellaceae bacterium]